MELNALLRRAVERGASDIHLKLRQPPVFRVDGLLDPVTETPPLTEPDLETALHTVVGSASGRLERFHQNGELDLAYSSEGLPRFRVNCFRQRGAVSLAFRYIPEVVPSFGELNLPSGVKRLALEERGLVIVTGASGVGKTTTLAAMIDEINRTRRQHIVTVEDPIEFLHHDRSCIVNQREVGIDTTSFHTALRSVLRQDPDVILIGELRDAETAETALQAAETGHLVFSTMHTIDAAETIARMIEFFPAVKQNQVRSVMASVLRGVISQRLLPRADGGRVPAVEVMVVNARIDELIREDRTNELQAAIDEGSFLDMQSFQRALIKLVLSDAVDADVAANASTNKHDFLVELDHALKRRKAEEEGWVDPLSENARVGMAR
jgi:twitching motility protein PilT